MKKRLHIVLFFALLLSLVPVTDAFAAESDQVTITVDIKEIRSGSNWLNDEAGYLVYYEDSEIHVPEYETDAVPAGAAQTMSLAAVPGYRVTFISPYYDFYSAVRIDQPDGSYKTIGASPRYGYVFDHWEGWNLQADQYNETGMPYGNEFTVKSSAVQSTITLTAVFKKADMTANYRIKSATYDEEPLIGIDTAKCGERVEIKEFNSMH